MRATIRDALTETKRAFHIGMVWVHLRWTIVRPASLAIFCALVGFVIFFCIGQCREILLRLAEELPKQGWPAASVWFFLAGLFGTTLAIWYASRSVLYVLYERFRPTLSLYRRYLGLQKYDRICRRWRKWTPRVVAVLPGLGAAAGLVVGYQELSNVGGRPSNVGGRPSTLAVLIVVTEFVLFIFFVFRGRLVRKIKQIENLSGERFTDSAIREYHRQADRPFDSLPERTRFWVICATCLSGALILLFGVPPAITRWLLGTAAIAQTMGSAFIILAAIGLFAFLGTYIFSHSVVRRSYGSVLGALLFAIVFAALVGHFGGTDNHAVRQLTGDAATKERNLAAERPSLEEHFARWLSLRAGLAKLERPYPVVVAAAQGGGVRAAMWTSVALGALQDRDPRFACGLFAITGVSGGALGALAFVANLDAELSCGEERDRASAAQIINSNGLECEETVPSSAACQLSDAFSEDFLAPALAGGLFPDLIQRFFPTGWLGFLLPDRQQFLEEAWEQELPGFFHNADGRPVGFLEITERDSTGPALFLVATEVEKGRRWIASDIRLDRRIFVDAVDTLTGRELRDDEPPLPCPEDDDPSCSGSFLALPASAAAGLSARFPYVSPPGMLTFTNSDGEDRIYHLLDGGIVESSGAATAAEILLAIHGWCARDHTRGGELVEGILRCSLRRASTTEPYKAVDRRRCDDEGHTCQTVYIRPAVLQLTNSPWSVAEQAKEAAERPGAAEFAELADPVRALWNSRFARGRWAHSWLGSARTLMAGRDDLDLDLKLIAHDDSTDDERVPLGWSLRGATAKRMIERVNEVFRDPEEMLKWLCQVYGPGSDPDHDLPSELLDGDLWHEPEVTGQLGTLKWKRKEDATIKFEEPDALGTDRSWTFCISTKRPTKIRPNLLMTRDLPDGATATIRLELNNGDGWRTIPNDPGCEDRGDCMVCEGRDECTVPMSNLVRVPPKGAPTIEPVSETTSLSGKLTVWLQRSKVSTPASITLHSLELVPAEKAQLTPSGGKVR